MSSTRTAKDDSVFHQARYASSPEFERGLVANLVAKRCALIDSAADRELIWFLHYLSHQDGGLAAVAGDLIARYSEYIGTASMLQIEKGEPQSYLAEEVHKIRMELPGGYRHTFPLKGETLADLQELNRKSQANRNRNRVEIIRNLPSTFEAEDPFRNLYDTDWERRAAEERERRERQTAQNQPSAYTVQAFREFCLKAATQGMPDGLDFRKVPTLNLERQLSEMCLNPEWKFSEGGPWYFPRLVETLREYQSEFVKTKSVGVVVTALGKKVCDTLDYTAYSRGLTLIQGEARTGKSFAARAWCEQHPGLARFVEVPPGNEETGFYRAIARGLGLGNFLNYKAAEIRERVESVLLTGNILLVLDEAYRLWPRMNARYGFPKRIEWVMAMANARVPIALVSTPQFIETQKAVERGGWNSAQLTGRIRHFEPLPVELSMDDLKAVARAVLPEADAEVLRALASYARSSARYLAAIESISDRARWLAARDGRKTATTEDVRAAMRESVIPSDTKLQRALASDKKSKPAAVSEGESTATSDLAALEPETSFNRMAAPDAPVQAPQRRDVAELATN